MRPLALTAALALLATPAFAEPDVRTLEAGKSPAPATLSTVAWLEGRWVGEGMGGQVEESYSGPVQGQMIGYFRLVRAGKPVFYQFVVIREAAGSLAYRLKHFNPDGTAWEDKERWVEFPLVALEGETAYFSGLTLERIGTDGLAAHVRMQAQGRSYVETFRFKRAR